MKIKAKKIVAEDIKFPTNQVEHAPIQDSYEDMPQSSRTKLEHEYLTSGLDYGDRLRLINDSGQLIDVILMPNGQIAVQQIQLRLEYGATTVYPDWEQADAQTQGYDFNKAIKASANFEKIVNLIKDAMKTNNPYRK